MTAREQEILEIIKKDPMISQSEIAERLNTTRSSVSVHITNLLKSGHLKGRGYVVENDKYSVFVGSTALDIMSVFEMTDQTIDPTRPQQDCRITFNYSGSARNVSEASAKLDMNTYLISAIANDFLGNHILDYCTQHGVNTEHCLIVNNVSTTMFIDVKSPSFNTTGLASSPIDSHITPTFLETKYSFLKNADQIAIEDRLQRETIDYLTSNFGTSQLFLMASRRFSNEVNYREYLDRFTGMQFSFLLASHLVGMDNFELLGAELTPDELTEKIARGLMEITNPHRHVIFPVPGGTICYLRHNHLYTITVPSAAKELDSFKTTREAMMAGLMKCVANNVPVGDALYYVAACHTISQINIDKPLSLCSQQVVITLADIKKQYEIRKIF